mmetsp:Transcript_118415/g.368782  ORF Transcript_118415/g.368782 Transcript_118415/m.368782 type:complete len:230 (-) Transcript_118415:120-809(-)
MARARPAKQVCGTTWLRMRSPEYVKESQQGAMMFVTARTLLWRAWHLPLCTGTSSMASRENMVKDPSMTKGAKKDITRNGAKTSTGPSLAVSTKCHRAKAATSTTVKPATPVIVVIRSCTPRSLQHRTTPCPTVRNTAIPESGRPRSGPRQPNACCVTTGTTDSLLVTATPQQNMVASTANTRGCHRKPESEGPPAEPGAVEPASGRGTSSISCQLATKSAVTTRVATA